MKRRRQRGNSLIEFTLVGIPMIFVLLSIFEVARLGWTFHTLSSAVGATARFAMVHGKNCGQAPNSCAVTVADVARRMKTMGAGLVPAETGLTLVSAGGAITCRLDECLNDGRTWPPAGANEPGWEIEIRATYSIRSMVAMFWPGAGAVAPFGLVRLPASAQEVIQF